MISFSGCSQKKDSIATKVPAIQEDAPVYIQWEATKLEYPYIDPEVEVEFELTEEQMVEKRLNPWKCVSCVETEDPNSK